MPLYEFTCTKCGKSFEQLVGSGANGSEVTCPFCDSEEVERLFSSFSSSGAGSPPAGGGSCGSGGFT